MGEPITGRVNEAVRRVSMGNSLVVIVRQYCKRPHWAFQEDVTLQWHGRNNP